jgi:hypothetical protein
MVNNKETLILARRFGEKAVVVTTLADEGGQIEKTLAEIPNNTDVDPCLLMSRVKGNIETMHVEDLSAAVTRHPKFV